ncbi:hypothetical protein PENSPDRAFT_252765 [Peniophora sp. CONT]|nr:hypothetical protein PENSPDRAFT_252765 [Peniophora sp. CONT]
MSPLSEVQSAIGAVIEQLNREPHDLAATIRPINDKILKDARDAKPYLDAIIVTIPRLWNVLWSQHTFWNDLTGITLVAALAMNFVNMRRAFPSPGHAGSTDWESTGHLPHLLVFCAVKLQEVAHRNNHHIRPSNLIGCIDVLSTSPSRVLSIDELRAFAGDMAKVVDPFTLSQTIIAAINDPVNVDFELLKIMQVALPFATSEHLERFFPTMMIFDAFEHAIARNRCNKIVSKKLKSMTLNAYVCFINDAIDSPFHRHTLLTGAYVLFAPLAEGLISHVEAGSAVENSTEAALAAYAYFLNRLEALLIQARSPGISRNRDPVPGFLEKFIPDLHHRAHKEMPGLLNACRVAISVSQGLRLFCWVKMLNRLVSFSLVAGVHPFCAASTCCLNVRYCSRECQKQHRKTHKEKCGRMLKG